MPDHCGPCGCLFLYPHFLKGTLPLACRLPPSPSAEEFPPHPASIPHLSSVLQGGSSVLPDPRPNGNHQLSQGLVILHFLMDHSPWALSATFSNFHNPLNSTSYNKVLLTSLRTHIQLKCPALNLLSPVSAQPLFLPYQEFCLFSTALVFVPSMGHYHQHFLSLLKLFPTLNKNFCFPLLPIAATALTLSALSVTLLES